MTFVLWICVAAALCACELASRRLARGWPTAGKLLGTARAHIGSRAVLVLAWLWLGWHVFAR